MKDKNASIKQLYSLMMGTVLFSIGVLRNLYLRLASIPLAPIEADILWNEVEEIVAYSGE